MVNTVLCRRRQPSRRGTFVKISFIFTSIYIAIQVRTDIYSKRTNFVVVFATVLYSNVLGGNDTKNMTKLNSKRGGIRNPLRRNKSKLHEDMDYQRNNIEKGNSNKNDNKDKETTDTEVSKPVNASIDNIQSCLQYLVEIKDSNDERLKNMEATMDKIKKEHETEMNDMKMKIGGFGKDIVHIEERNKEREHRFRMSYEQTKGEIQEQETRMKSILGVISESIGYQERNSNQDDQITNANDKEEGKGKHPITNEKKDCGSTNVPEDTNSEEINMVGEDKSPISKEDISKKLEEKTRRKSKKEGKPSNSVTETGNKQPDSKSGQESRPDKKEQAIPESNQNTKRDYKESRNNGSENKDNNEGAIASNEDTVTVPESDRKQGEYPYIGEFIVKAEDRHAYRQMAIHRKYMC